MAVGRGDRQLRPDRRGALRDARQHLDAVEPHADRAVARRPRRRRTARPRPSSVRALDSPPSTGTPGAASAQVAQHRVGRERVGVGEQDRPGGAVEVGQARRRQRPPRAPRLGVERRRLGRRRASAAQTATAVPSSISRPRPSTPPAPQPISAAGASASWTASSVASGAARWAPDANTTARSHGARRRARAAAAGAASIAPARASGSVERPAPMRTPMPADDTPRRARRQTRDRALRADRRRQDRRRDRARRAPARRARRGPRGGVRRRAAGLRGPRDPHRRGHARPSARASSTGSCRFLPVDATFSAGAVRRSSRTPRSTALLAAGRRPIVVGGTGLYLRAALAELDLRPPPPDGVRERRDGELQRAGAPRPARASSPRARPGPPRRSSPPTASASCARSSCSTPAELEPPPERRVAAVDRPTRATRRCSPA